MLLSAAACLAQAHGPAALAMRAAPAAAAAAAAAARRAAAPAAAGTPAGPFQPCRAIHGERTVYEAQSIPLRTGRPRLVVLGTGWAAARLVRDVDPKLYDLTVLSPRK